MPDANAHHPDMLHRPKPNVMPAEYYTDPAAYARRLKSDLHAVHELAEQDRAALVRLSAENARLRAELYQHQVLNELNATLNRPPHA